MDTVLWYLRDNDKQSTNSGENNHERQYSVGGLFSYDEKFWIVPKMFEFPRGTTRRRAWELWLCSTTVGQSVVPPFRKFKSNLLPQKIRNRFKTQWYPILAIMERSLKNQYPIPENVRNIDSNVISDSYAAATENLKTKLCSFLWSDVNMRNLEGWSVGTWSMKTRRNKIVRQGNETDKMNLAEATRYNEPHTSKEKRTFNQVRNN